MSDDAAAIINSKSGIEVKGVERALRDPHRDITVVLMAIPSCEQFPGGKELWVHPRQIARHLELYPGSYIIKELKRRLKGRKAQPSGITPKGHVRDHTDFAPNAIVTR